MMGYWNRPEETAKVVDCGDDKEAVRKAMLIADGFSVEIWDQKRFIARLPANPPKPA